MRSSCVTFAVWMSANAGSAEVHDVAQPGLDGQCNTKPAQPPTSTPTFAQPRRMIAAVMSSAPNVIIRPQQAARSLQPASKGELGGLGESDRVSRGSFHHSYRPPGTTKDVGRRPPPKLIKGQLRRSSGYITRAFITI